MSDTPQGPEAAPQPASTPGAAGTATPGTPAPDDISSIEKELAVNEKRLADKKAYLESLQAQSRAKIGELDKQINEAKNSLKAEAEILERRMRAAPPPEPVAPPPSAPAPAPAAPAATGAEVSKVANMLGISGEEAVQLLDRAPDTFFNTLAQAVDRTVEQRMQNAFREFEERQRANATQEQIHSRFSESAGRLAEAGHNPVEMMALLERYRVAGLAPTPEHLENEVRFGPLDVQRHLLEVGKAYIEQIQAETAAAGRAAPAPGQVPGMPPRPHPGMALPRGNGIPPVAAPAPDPNVKTVNLGASHRQRLDAAAAATVAAMQRHAGV